MHTLVHPGTTAIETEGEGLGKYEDVNSKQDNIYMRFTFELCVDIYSLWNRRRIIRNMEEGKSDDSSSCTETFIQLTLFISFLAYAIYVSRAERLLSSRCCRIISQISTFKDII
jgi:hypothetical protein